MDIREAAETDIEAIAEIYQYYVRTNICTLEEQQPSVNDVRNEFSQVFATGAPFIVAIDGSDGRLMGYAYSGPFNPRSGYNATCEDSIYIHHDYCRNGIGKKLLQALLDAIRASSRITNVIAKMSISPEDAVEDVPSCRLHMSFGFQPVGRLIKVGRKFDKWIDVVILQLELEGALFR